MKKRILLAFITLATTSGVYSQVRDYQEVIRTQNRIERDSRDKQIKNVDGSQYFDLNYFKLNIPGSQTELAKYNAYTDKIEILNGSDVRILTPERGVTLSSVDSKKQYIYTEYTNKKNESVVGYLNIISKNPKVSLFKKEQIILVPEAEPKSPYDIPKPAHYKKLEPEYFIQLNEDGKIIPLSKKKKEIEGTVTGKEKETKTFIKENKISLSNEEDLIKLAIFLNSIS